jgi:hypothetical protein
MTEIRSLLFAAVQIALLVYIWIRSDGLPASDLRLLLGGAMLTIFIGQLGHVMETGFKSFDLSAFGATLRATAEAKALQAARSEK